MKKITYITSVLCCMVGMYFGLMTQANAQCPTNSTPPMPSVYCVDSATFDITILGSHINWYSDNQLPNTPGLDDPVLSTRVNAGFTYYIIYSDTSSTGVANTTTRNVDCPGGPAAATPVSFVMRGVPPTLPNGGLVCVSSATGCFALNSVPGVFKWYHDISLIVPLDLNSIGGCVGPGTYYATVQDANGCETSPATLTVRGLSATPGSVGGYISTLNMVDGCAVFCPDPIVGGIDLDTLVNNSVFADPVVDIWYEDSLLTVQASGINGPGTYYGINIGSACRSAAVCIKIDDVPTAPVVDPVMTCVPFAGIDIVTFAVLSGAPATVTDGEDLNWYSDANLTTQIFEPGVTATPYILPMPAPGMPVEYWVTYGGALSPACESAPTKITLKGTPDTIMSYNCPLDPGPVGTPSGGFGIDCMVGSHFQVRTIFCIDQTVDAAVVEANIKMAPGYAPAADSLCYYSDSMMTTKATLADLIAGSAAFTGANVNAADTFYVTQWIDGCQSVPTAVGVYVTPKPMLELDARAPGADNPLAADTTVCPGIVINLADVVRDSSWRITGTPFSYADEWYFYIGDPLAGGILIDNFPSATGAFAGRRPAANDPNYPIEVIAEGTKTYYIVAVNQDDPFVDPICADTIVYTVIADDVPFMNMADAGPVCSDVAIGVTLAVDPASVAADGFNVEVIIDGGLVAAANPAAPTPSGPGYVIGTTPSTSGELGFLQAGDIANHTYTNTTTGPLNVTYIASPSGATLNDCEGPLDTFVVVITPAPSTVSNTDAVACNLESACVDFTLDNGLTDGAWTLDAVTLAAGLVAEGDTGAFTMAGATAQYCINNIKNETAGPLDVTIDVTYTNACGSASGQATITVNPGPVIESNLSDKICSGQTTNNALSTTAGSINAIAYKWGGPAFTDYAGAAAMPNGGQLYGGTNSNGTPEPNNNQEDYGDFVYNSTFPLGQVYIRDSFVNTSGAPVIATYKVIALGDTTPLYGCQSDTMMVTDTLMPVPLFTDLDTFDLCSDGAIINLASVTPTQLNGPVPGVGTWYRSSHGATGPVSGVQSVSNGDIFYYTYVTGAGCSTNDTLVINLDEAPILPPMPAPAVCAQTVGTNLAGGAVVDLRDYMPNIPGNEVDANVTFGGGGNAPGNGSWYAGAAASGTPIDTALNAVQNVRNGDQFTYEFTTDPDGDGNVCNASITLTVTVNPQPNAVLTGGGAICPPTNRAPNVMATFDGVGPWTVMWTDGTNNYTNVVAVNPWPLDDSSGVMPSSGATPGQYQVMNVVDQNGCTYVGPSNQVNVDTNGVIAICADITVNLNSSGFIQINSNATDNGSIDGCNSVSGNLSFDVSQKTFTCADIGVQTVDMYVTNGTDSDTCSANVTVQDCLPPVLICPLDVANTATFSTDAGECYATAPAGFFAPRVISDNCEVDSIWYSYTICDSTYIVGFSGFEGEYSQQNAQGSFGVNVPVFGTISLAGAKLPKGSYDITLYVKDKQGHQNGGGNTGLITSCTKSVVIEDNEIPVFTFVTPDTIDVYTSSATAAGFGCKAEVPDSTITEQNYMNCPDWTHNGDYAGQMDLTVRQAGQPDNVIRVLEWADNCKVESIVPSVVSSDFFTGCDGDLSEITYTITDCGGNTEVAKLVFRINDDEDPMIVCPADTIIDCSASYVKGDTATTMAPALLGMATGTDNSNDCAATCTQPVITYEDTYPNYASPCIGPDTIYLTRTWTITDQAGNTAMCVQKIGIHDTTPPMFDASGIATDTACVLAEAAPFSSLADFMAAGGTSSDDCDLVASTFCQLGDRKEGLSCPQIVWRKYGISDRCGNKTIDSVKIVIGDFEDPVVTAPAAITIDCEDDQSPANTGMGTGTDNCSSYGFYITWADVSTQGADASASDYYNYTITRTWTATDTCGNKDTDVQVITVQDTMAPAFDNCPVAAITLNNDAGLCSATLPSTVLTASDNCAAAANITILNDYNVSTSGSDIGGVYPVGTTTVTLTASDPSVAAGDATCVVTVTVTDNEAPVVTCGNVSITKSLSQSAGFPGGDGFAVVKPSDLGTWMDNCGIDTAIVDIDTVYCSDIGAPLTVTLTVTDIYNNSTNTCTGSVTVVDNRAPITNCNNITVYLDQFCAASIVPSDIDMGLSYDNCSIVSQSLSKDVFDQDDLTRPAQPPIAVTLTSVDQSGNADNSCVALVTVRDTIDPVLTCRPSSGQITVVAPQGVCEAFVIVPVPSNGDNCLTTTLVAEWTINGVTSNAPQAVDNFPVGTTVVTQTIFDRAGNSDFCTVSVTVLDNEDPNAVCKPFVVSLDAAGNATVTGNDIDGGSTDNCSIMTYEIARENPGSGGSAFLPFGNDAGFTCADLGSNNTVRLLVTDPSGNTDTCNTTVTVIDDIDPTCTTQDITVYLSDMANGSVSITPADIVTGSADNCSVVDTTLDQSTFSCSGAYCGAAYTVTATVTDQSGNTGTCTATVTVEDTIAPTPLCKTADILLDVTGNQVVTVDSVKAGVSDNCSVSREWVMPTSFNCADIGNQNVTYYAEDLCGNVDSCIAVVDVRDEVSPVAICQNITLQLDATGNTRTIVPADIDNGSIDACGISSYVLDITDFDCSDVGVNNVVLTVTDNYNNFAVCIALVTVEDNIDPTALCAADFTVTLSNAAGGAGSVGIVVGDIDNNSVDNCAVQSTDINGAQAITFTCGDLGVNTITLTVTDVNGNSSTCTTDVTVQDTDDPIITSRDTTSCNDLGVCSDDVMGYMATVDDNCSVDSTSTTITINAQPWAGYTGLTTIVRTNSLDASYNYPVGTHTVVFYAEDQSGNNSSTSQTVTINDCENPQVVGCPADQVLPNVTGDCYQQAGWTAPTATDNCMVDNIQQLFSDPTIRPIAFGASRIALFPVGITTVEYVATDKVGNTDTCRFTITVEDIEFPTIKVNGVDCATTTPANISVNTDPGFCTSQVILPNVVAEDNCDGGGPLSQGTLSLTNNVPTGGVFQVGTTPLTYTATDPWGNVTTCSFDVTVTDNENPTIACPADITVNNDPGACSASVTYAVSAADNCTGVIGFQGVFNPGNWTFTNGGGDASVDISDAPDSIKITSSNNGVPVAGTLSIVVQADGILSFDWDYITSDIDAFQGFNRSFPDRFGYSLNGSGFVRLTRDNGFNTGDSVQSGSTSIEVRSGDVFAFVANTFDATSGAATTTLSNIALSVQPVQLGGLVSGSSFPVGTTLNAFRVSDLSGNTALCSFTVTVNDTEDPVVVCPADITMMATTGCNAQVNVPAAVAYDNCGTGATPITLQTADFNNSAMPTGWTNTGTGCATGWDFRVNAVGGPLGGPGNINGTPMAVFSDDSLGIGCSGDSGELTTGAVDASAYSGLTLNFDYNYRHGDFDEPSSFEVEVYNGTAWVNVMTRTSDDAGEWNAGTPGPFSSASIDVSAHNNANFQVRFIYTDGGTAGTNQAWNWYAAVDNYELVGSLMAPINDFNGTADASGMYPVGITTVTYTAADASGNTATCTFDVTVTDNGNPTITCPNDTTIDADANNCGAVFTYAASATDGCDPTVTIGLVSGLGSGGYFPVGGPYTETLEALDTSGNSDQCSFTVTVVDKTNPIITGLPANITQDNDPGVCQAVVTWDESVIVTSDNCPGESLAATHSSGMVFPVGTTTVTYTATDAAGNTSTGSFTITVEDNEDPIATCIATTVVVQLDATGNGSTTAAAIDNGSTDNCGIASTTLDKSSFSCADVGNNTVTLTVTDIHGNSATCTATVDVQDNVNPTALCQNVIVQLDASGAGSLAAGDVNNGSSDACGITGLSVSPNMFGCADVGANTVTLTVTDANGNTGTCTATADVQDNVNPVVVCSTATVQLNANGLASVTAAQVSDGGSDACGIASVTVSPNQFGCINLGANTVTVTATDANGNIGTCTTTVTVEDNIDPVFTSCPSNQTLTADPAAGCGAVATWTTPIATDNCSATVAQTAGQASGSSFAIGTTTITYTATDAAGNTDVCTFDITVNAPTITADILTTSPLDLCAEDANTTVNAAAIGTGYSGQWSAVPGAGVTFGSATSASTTVSFPSSGTYTLTWTVSACGAIGSDAITVRVFDAPTTSVAGTDPSTVGGTDGDATVTVTGGSGNFSYLWTDAQAQTMATAMGLGAGTYYVTVTDNVSGCSVEDSVTLSDPALINICDYLDFQSASFGAQFGGGVTGIPGSSLYTWANGGGRVLEYASGEIRIVGEIYDRADLNKRWIVDIWLMGETFWTQWNAAGNTWFSSYTPITTQFQTWKYYTLDASRSRLFGVRNTFFAGEVLLLTPNSATPNEGWQKGDRGANGKDGDYGLGGTFEYTSTSRNYTGNGGFFGDFNGCRNPQRGVRIAPVVMLEGAYDATSGVMRDDLRSGTLLPTTEPYTGLGYGHLNGGGGEVAAAAVFTVTGNDAIVDWVTVELRDRNNPAIVVATRSALLQRDGDVVDVDGTSTVAFPTVNEGDYYVVVSHRSHLGVMTAAPSSVLATANVALDFTATNTPTYGSGAQKLNSNGVCLLFGGDANGNGQVQNTDDVQHWMPQAGTAGYRAADYDLNGQVQNTDRVYLWMQNAGRGSQTPTRQN
ncbi:MAG: HYR domain-containing protein [Bacteroidia bacterium]